MEHDYNIKTIGAEELYNLLPHVVRAQDPGILVQYFRALAAQHNFLGGRLRELPRSQDPTVAGRFTSAALGEDPALFAQWLALKRLPLRTAAEDAQAAALALRVPASVAAREHELQVLSLLARTAGESVEAGIPDAALRPLLATAVRRHHIRGTPASIELLGRILGPFEIKVRELWTRFSVADPSDPLASSNDDDYAIEPEQYPYWPRSDHYGEAPEDRQWPLGTAGYSPFELADGGTGSMVFAHLLTNRRSDRYYLAVVNGRNPWIRILGDVPARLQPGTYQLAGGDGTQRARAAVPLVDGVRTAAVEAVVPGDYGNQVSLRVQNTSAGTQTLTVDGPRSRIKFRSSVFDLVFGADAAALYSLVPAVPVEKVPDATAYDAGLGRDPGEEGGAYPVTGSLTGVREVADPDLHFQLDRGGFSESMTVLRSLVEGLRPVTRTLRRRPLALVVSSSVLYAPSCVATDVVLEGQDGGRWRVAADASGVLSWVATADAATDPAPAQYDRAARRWVRWAFAGGVFAADPVANPDGIRETLVHLPGRGHLYVEGGRLVCSGQFPESTEVIHGDGTPDESVLRTEYAEVSDPPGEGAAPFMSADAAYGGAPPECLRFQAAPEDEAVALPTLSDSARFHVAPGLGVDVVPGEPSASWGYGVDGQLRGTDLRLRSAGVVTREIDPVPTGDNGNEDGLTYGYPIQFLDYHGEFVTRDRYDNAASRYRYTYDSLGPTSGATLVGPFSESTGDGPTEGPVPEGWIAAESVGAGAHDAGTVAPWQRYHFFEMPALTGYAGTSSAAGRLRLDGIIGDGLAPGATLVVASGPYAGAHRVVSGTPTAVVTATAFASATGAGTAWCRHGSFRPEGLYPYRLTLRGSAGPGLSATCEWRVWTTGDGGTAVLDSGTLSPGETLSRSYPDEASEVWVETKGVLTGTGEWELPAGPPAIVRTGSLMAQDGRDDVRIHLVDPGQRWWEFSQAAGAAGSSDPLGGGEKWWRGGQFRGELAGTYIDRGSEMPDELVLTGLEL